MTQVVPPPYAELSHRLALGVEPIDAGLGTRVAEPLCILLDGVPFPKPPWGQTPSAHWFEYASALRGLSRHGSSLHVLLGGPAVESPVHIRIFDRARLYAPRRLAIELPPPQGVAMVKPRLYPGAAYPVSARATGLRGRALRSATSEPVRWARVAAFLPGTDTVVGRAHGDDRGEFLLILGSEALGIAAIVDPIPLEIRIYGPATAPTPGSPSLPAQDPLWDLPLEDASVPGTLEGEAVPGGHTELSISYQGSPPATPYPWGFTPAGPIASAHDFLVQ